MSRPPRSSSRHVERLSALTAGARAAWPRVQLDPGVFRDRLEAAIDGADDPVRALAALAADDLYLACALAKGDPAAVAAFEREILAHLPKFIARVGTDASFVDEVAQRVREKLLVGPAPRIARYSGKGPLGGWVRMVSVRVALDVMREHGQQPSTGDEDTLAAVASGDVELQLLKARYRDDVKAAFDAAFASLSAGERNLLRLHLVESLNIDEIAVLQRAHRSTVARQIGRCRDKLIGETRRLLRARFGEDDAQVDSLIRLVRSQMDLSIRTCLR